MPHVGRCEVQLKIARRCLAANAVTLLAVLSQHRTYRARAIFAMSRKRKRVDDDYHSDDQYEEWIAQDDGGFKKRILLQVDIPQKALQCICTHVPQADLLAFALACRGFRRAQVAARPEQLLLHASHLKWGLPRRFQRQEVSMFFNLLSIKREEEAVAPEAAAATDAPADLAADASAPYKVVAAVRTPDGSERPLTEYEYSHVALLQPSFRLVEQPRRPGGIGGFRYPRAPRGQNYFTVRDLVDVVGRSRDAGKEFLRLAAARSQQHGEISLKLEWLDLGGIAGGGRRRLRRGRRGRRRGGTRVRRGGRTTMRTGRRRARPRATRVGGGGGRRAGAAAAAVPADELPQRRSTRIRGGRGPARGGEGGEARVRLRPAVKSGAGEGGERTRGLLYSTNYFNLILQLCYLSGYLRMVP